MDGADYYGVQTAIALAQWLSRHDVSGLMCTMAKVHLIATHNLIALDRIQLPYATGLGIDLVGEGAHRYLAPGRSFLGQSETDPCAP